MNPERPTLFLIIFLAFAILLAGCTTTTTIGNPTPAQTPAAAAAAATAAPAAIATPAGASGAVAVSTTPACPDKAVWNGKWDTRWVSEGRDIAPTTDAGWEGYPWTGTQAVSATPLQMTQTCWAVTGTYVPGSGDGSGTLTANIKGNQLTGSYNTGKSSSTDAETGTFTLTMAADNQSWIGYAKTPERTNQDPNNWAGKKIG